jgi:hypothetical protein
MESVEGMWNYIDAAKILSSAISFPGGIEVVLTSAQPESAVYIIKNK